MASSDENARRKKKRDQEVKNRIKNMSKEAMAAAIARKKECNSRAMLIVEHLIEPNVDQLWLLENLKHINQSHFQDIVEERAITRLCGYPLCDGELTNVPKKMYKISTKENKVYDITDRKNYCSNICYKAGTYLKDQLYTSPLWLRDCETPVEYKILSGSKESKGTGAGAEIDLGNTCPVKIDNSSTNEEKTNEEIQSPNNPEKSSILKHKNPQVKHQSEMNDNHELATQERAVNLTSKTIEKNVQKTLNCSVGDNHSYQSSGSNSELVLNCVNDCNISTELLDTSNLIYDSLPTESICSSSMHTTINTTKDEILTPIMKTDIDKTPKRNDSPEKTYSPSSNEIVSDEKTIKLSISSISHESLELKRKNITKKDISDNLSEEFCTRSKSSTVNDNLNSTGLTGIEQVQDLKLNSGNSNKSYIKMGSVCDNFSELSCNKRTDRLKKSNVNKPLSKVKKTPKNNESPLTCVVSDIERRVESWFTLESMVFLLGQERLRELLELSGFKEDFPFPRSSKKEDYMTYQKCQEIYKKLNILELKDKDKQIPSKPVPDYESLQKEVEDFELKVKTFFQGDSKVTFAPTENINDISESSTENADVLALPLIDHYAIIATRRRIFIDKLNKVLPDMLSALELSQFRFGLEIQQLVSTFSLEATNICLRPPEWALVAIMLIKLLTINNEILNFAYSRELTQRRLMAYLLTYDLDGGYLDRFTSYLMDIERIATAIQPDYILP